MDFAMTIARDGGLSVQVGEAGGEDARHITKAGQAKLEQVGIGFGFPLKSLSKGVRELDHLQSLMAACINELDKISSITGG